MISNQLDITASYRRLCHLKSTIGDDDDNDDDDNYDNNDDDLNKRLTHDIKVSVQLSHS